LSFSEKPIYLAELRTLSCPFLDHNPSRLLNMLASRLRHVYLNSA